MGLLYMVNSTLTNFNLTIGVEERGRNWKENIQQKLRSLDLKTECSNMPTVDQMVVGGNSGYMVLCGIIQCIQHILHKFLCKRKCRERCEDRDLGLFWPVDLLCLLMVETY